MKISGIMKSGIKQPPTQSNFFSLIETNVPKPVELKVVERYLTFPKAIFNSLHCPDCGTRVELRADGLTVCPKCTIKVPYGEAQGMQKI